MSTTTNNFEIILEWRGLTLLIDGIYDPLDNAYTPTTIKLQAHPEYTAFDTFIEHIFVYSPSNVLLSAFDDITQSVNELAFSEYQSLLDARKGI
jgi:hypothetical protein